MQRNKCIKHIHACRVTDACMWYTQRNTRYKPIDLCTILCRATAKMISLTLAIIVVLANCIRYCGTIYTILPTGNIVSMVEHNSNK